jgi:hypothetical protein
LPRRPWPSPEPPVSSALSLWPLGGGDPDGGGGALDAEHGVELQTLYDAIVEQRLAHPDDPRLNAHVAAAVARHSRRGWRIDRAERGENIDAVVAMAMAVEIAAARPEPVKLLGWL